MKCSRSTLLLQADRIEPELEICHGVLLLGNHL